MTPADRLRLKFAVRAAVVAVLISAIGSVGLFLASQQQIKKTKLAVASLCAQSKITDGLVLAAVELVAVEPNSPEDNLFIATFTDFHKQIISNKDCTT